MTLLILPVLCKQAQLCQWIVSIHGGYHEDYRLISFATVSDHDSYLGLRSAEQLTDGGIKSYTPLVLSHDTFIWKIIEERGSFLFVTVAGCETEEMLTKRIAALMRLTPSCTRCLPSTACRLMGKCGCGPGKLTTRRCGG
jgi:hypothetical protein